MKRLLSILFIIISISNAVAQTDAKAQEILKGVSAKYKSYKSLSANFKLSVLDQKTKKMESQSGTIIIRGGQFNLMMADQTVMSDGKTTWTYLKESNEVQISETKTTPDAITPTTVFTMYEKGFKSKFLSEKPVGGKTTQIIELVPEDNKKTYFKIQLSIDKEGKYVSEAKIFNKDGNIMTYSILKLSPNSPITDDDFIFNNYFDLI